MRLAGLGTYVQTQHDDRDDVVGQGEIDLLHDQDLVISEARLGVDVAITKRFGASLLLPIRVISTSIRYLDLGGDEVALVRPGIHHRTETVSGIADPMVLGAVTHTLGGLRLVARGGVTLPIGRTEANPFAPATIDLPHQHIQMGTGTLNLVGALEVSQAWGAWRVGGFAFTQQVVYESDKGYQAGDRYAAGLSVRRALGMAWSVRGGTEIQAETAERWGGVIQLDDGNRGRLDAMLVAGASWAATKDLSFDLALKLPVVTHIVGGQLSMPVILELGVAWSFNTPAPPAAKAAAEDEDDHDHGDDEHGHDHGDEHGDGQGDAHAVALPSGVDVADLGAPGEGVDLVPVPGKLTIFDFWATWCEPCKTLEPALIELARAHPEVVAVRRIDVVDWDSAAAARHLTPGGFGLPHLKIYDPSGALVLERSSATGQLDALIAAVRALVEVAAAAPEKP